MKKDARSSSEENPRDHEDLSQSVGDEGLPRESEGVEESTNETPKSMKESQASIPLERKSRRRERIDLRFVNEIPPDQPRGKKQKRSAAKEPSMEQVEEAEKEEEIDIVVDERGHPRHHAKDQDGGDRDGAGGSGENMGSQDTNNGEEAPSQGEEQLDTRRQEEHTQHSGQQEAYEQVARADEDLEDKARMRIRKYLRSVCSLEETPRPEEISVADWDSYFLEELKLHAWIGKQYFTTLLEDLSELMEEHDKREFEHKKKVLNDASARIGEPSEAMLAKNFEKDTHVWSTLVLEDSPVAAHGLSSQEAKTDMTTSEALVEDETDLTEEAYADCLLKLPLPFQGHKVPFFPLE